MIWCSVFSRAAAAVVLAATLLGGVEARAQALSVQGDRFAIDGSPKFLTFISYFGAMGAGNIAADFHFLRAHGFDGVRIWPLLFTGPQLMNGDGTLRADGLERLRFVLDRAREERLVVDVSFTGEHIPGLDAGRFKDGIVAAAAALRDYENILFDIENERNVYGPAGRPLGAADVAAIYAAVKAVHPQRIVTASNSSTVTPEFAGAFTSDLGLDVAAYHDPREFNWFTLDLTGPVVNALSVAGKPVYLQEPMPTRGDPRFPYYPQTDRSDYFLAAVANAKLAGAAAWCFHTSVASDMRGASSFIEDRLRAFPEPEWTFVTSLVTSGAGIALQTDNGVNFIAADGGGGGDVRASSTTVSTWEVFTLSIAAGGPLVSGDRVTLRTSDGVHYLQAVGGGGASLRATATSAGAFETFIAEKPTGGVILPGDQVRLLTSGSSLYMVADGGGGGAVNVNRPSAGPWETFRVQLQR